MNKTKTKNSKATTFTLDVEVVRMLNDYSKISMIPKTRIVEKAIVEYIKKGIDSNSAITLESDNR